MCVTRRLKTGGAIYLAERITREQALRMYTTGGAWLQFAENERGTLEKGKLADAVVIDRDFLSCPEDDLRRIQPLMTIVGGRIAYRRSM